MSVVIHPQAAPFKVMPAAAYNVPKKPPLPPKPVMAVLNKPVQVQVIQPQPQQQLQQPKQLDPTKIEQVRQKLIGRQMEAVIAKIDKIFDEEIDYVADYCEKYGKDPEGTVTFRLPAKVTEDEKGDKHIEFSDTLLFGMRVQKLLKDNITKTLQTEKLSGAQQKFFDAVLKKLVATYKAQGLKYGRHLSNLYTVENITNRNPGKSLLLQSTILELNGQVHPRLILELFK
jgi:hypothetical protein